MELNQFIWKNYKESKEGQETIKFFETGYLNEILRKFVEEKNKDLDYCCNLMWQILELSIIPDDVKLENLYTYIVENGLKGFDEEENQEYDIYYKEDYDFLLSTIEPLSMTMYTFREELNSPYYIPYLFDLNFARLQKIADTFNVELPKVPLKKEKRERVDYYLKFCEIWKEFAQKNNLTIYELCAFLYDFAPKYIGFDEVSELPEPTNIWITGAGYKNGDYKFLSEADENSSSTWSGNQEAKKGDIVLMYCLSPKSEIGFIGRCLNDGIRDPFFWYYGVINIGKFQKIEPLKLAEIKVDEYLKELPIVRKNFQGVNGTRLGNEDYKRILELLEAKGQDISLLPKLSSIEFPTNTDCKNERDVEIKIVEPFLHNIGYSEEDWLRQLPVRMGRGERNYPDYVFFAETKKGYEKAKMLLETKFFIKSNQDLEETFQQAHSYALRLSAEIIIICDKDYFWIYLRKNGSFDRTKYFKYHWQQLNDPEIFNKVKKITGKEFIN